VSETVYSKALDLLRKDGWRQVGGPPEGRCVVSSLLAVADDLAVATAAVQTVARHVGVAQSVASAFALGDWNDAPERSFEDVALVLKQAHYEVCIPDCDDSAPGGRHFYPCDQAEAIASAECEAREA
jgi:hypothetical protein